MPQLYQTKIWQVLLPDGWHAKALMFECANFFKPDGVGQLSVMALPEDSDIKPKREGQFGALTGSYHESNLGHNFSRTWWLACKSRWLLVKYTCAPHFAEDERSEVDKIIETLAESNSGQG
jgi:hypothetical protein